MLYHRDVKLANFSVTAKTVKSSVSKAMAFEMNYSMI